MCSVSTRFTPDALAAICHLLDPFEGDNGKGRFLVGNALEILSDELLLLCAGITNNSECRDFDMIENTLRGIQLRVEVLSKVAKQISEDVNDEPEERAA